jgi:hypothetical protein
MKGKRTGIEFKDYEVKVTQQEGLLVHFLKKPDTICGCIKYINTNGIMAVTGDYGNWIFCREFHPSADGDDVSDGYWNEKLSIASTQQPREFDPKATREKIEELLREGECNGDLDEDEKVYLRRGLALVDDEFEYKQHAYGEKCGQFADGEYVPCCTKNPYWLDAIYDGFEEICRRMKEASGEKERS